MEDQPTRSALEEKLLKQVATLEEEARERKKELHMAGEIGNQILEKNAELTTELEKRSKEYTNKIDVITVFTALCLLHCVYNSTYKAYHRACHVLVPEFSPRWWLCVL